ncbi:hypothetical protein [Verminephrobacter aporrectodeae]|uniref:hypothetical protein n=1 Tax=Verminephrobacter aporrectodeae TaxID=1110389 RepID=UPI0022439958|nr:hypothetical protein [Verminephrobacter aporrectodeae]
MPLRRLCGQGDAEFFRSFSIHADRRCGKQEQQAAGKTGGNSEKYPSRSRARNQHAGQRVSDKDAALQGRLREPRRSFGVEHSRNGQLPHQGLYALLADKADARQSCSNCNQGTQVR